MAWQKCSSSKRKTSVRRHEQRNDVYSGAEGNHGKGKNENGNF